MWSQSEPVLNVLNQIQCGILLKNVLFRQLIVRIFNGIEDEELLQRMTNSFLDEQDENRDVAECLLTHMGDKAGCYLIGELFACDDREKRFSILDIIPSKSSVVVPTLMQRFETKQPWYVLRNSLLLLARLDDPDLYMLAKPFLLHADSRV